MAKKTRARQTGYAEQLGTVASTGDPSVTLTTTFTTNDIIWIDAGTSTGTGQQTIPQTTTGGITYPTPGQGTTSFTTQKWVLSTNDKDKDFFKGYEVRIYCTIPKTKHNATCLVGPRTKVYRAECDAVQLGVDGKIYKINVCKHNVGIINSETKYFSFEDILLSVSRGILQDIKSMSLYYTPEIRGEIHTEGGIIKFKQFFTVVDYPATPTTIMNYWDSLLDQLRILQFEGATS